MSYSAQGYDGHGRTDWTENANGARTYYVYNRAGDVTHTSTIPRAG